MRNFLASSLFILISLAIGAQNQNIDHLGSLDYQNLHNSEVSDVWGYVDENGNEYAIVGVNDSGVSIVDVTNPSNPVEVYYSEALAPTNWRDIKTVNDHAYIVNEAGGGMKIIDLGPLPGSTNLSESTYTAGGMFYSAHNLYIDEDSVAYVFGSDHGVGGAIMLDLSNTPMSPSLLGTYDQYYIHDGMVRNDTLYACQINVGNFAIIDVNNPSNPQVIGTHSTPYDFTHNAWVSDDGDHLYTTDEKSGAYIASYDISDPSNIQELDRIRVEPGSGSIPHNTHFMNEYLITSYYRDGVVIHDVKSPGNMVQVGRYDVAPGMSGSGFNGAWGVYPWLPSGNLLVSDIEDGLHILGPDYKRGCYLEGTITDQSNGNPINDAICRIQPNGPEARSTITGDYSQGIGTPGSYDIIFSHPHYFPDTLFNVPMSRDSLTIRDVQLEPRPQETVRFEIEDAFDGSSVQGAELKMVLSTLDTNGPSYSGSSNASGVLELNGVYQGDYELHAGKWGYMPYCDNSVSITGPDTVTIELIPGYGDDFAVDLGWTVSSSSDTGQWERGKPKGTSYQGFPLNPDEDASGDCGEEAYVTGNQGTGPWDDQVDTLSTILRSPKMDLSDYINPVLLYSHRFATATTSGIGDDSMFVKLEGAGFPLVLDTITAYAQNWEMNAVELSPYHPFGDSVQVRFVAEDIDGNTITEAGIDMFRVVDQTSAPQVQASEKETLRVMPVPFKENFKLRWEGSEHVRIQLYDLQGRKLKEKEGSGHSDRMDGSDLDPGVYILRVHDAKDGTPIGRERVVKE